MVGMFLALVGHELAKTCPKGCVQGFFAIFGVAEGLWCATGKGASEMAVIQEGARHCQDAAG